jgi:hypothetical protein
MKLMMRWMARFLLMALFCCYSEQAAANKQSQEASSRGKRRPRDKFNKDARAWLSSCSYSAMTNVTGVWISRDWGAVRLEQAANSRDVTGYGDGWDITGVVSGDGVCLLFTPHNSGAVQYSAKLQMTASDQLSGRYASGLLEDGQKGKEMRLSK